MSSRGLVAIPVRLSDDAIDARTAAANRLFHAIADLVREAGLDVVTIDPNNINLDGIDAVVLPGGGDIDPTYYGGIASSELYDVNEDQDRLDFAVANIAFEKSLPVLGICRGAQLINVALGGDLYVDLAPGNVVHRHQDSETHPWAWHTVNFTEGSSLSDFGTTNNPVVSSGHHQGIRKVADVLTVAAIAGDGLVEAVENSERHILGIQWHPEAEDCVPEVRDAPFAWLARKIDESRLVGVESE